MKHVLILLFICLMTSCSSDKPKKEIHALALPSHLKSRVEIKDEQGNLEPVIQQGSKTVTVVDPLTGKTYETKGWVDAIQNNRTKGDHLKKLNFDQLFKRAGNCSPSEAVLIIDEVRSRRDIKGVKVMARFLNDRRKTIFNDRDQYWWYEKKGDAEELEVRIYAALALQFQLKQAPKAVLIFVDYEQNLCYAIKDRFAVVKDDVAMVWLRWWQDNRADYE